MFKEQNPVFPNRQIEQQLFLVHGEEGTCVVANDPGVWQVRGSGGKVGHEREFGAMTRDDGDHLAFRVTVCKKDLQTGERSRKRILIPAPASIDEIELAAFLQWHEVFAQE